MYTAHVHFFYEFRPFLYRKRARYLSKNTVISADVYNCVHYMTRVSLPPSQHIKLIARTKLRDVDINFRFRNSARTNFSSNPVWKKKEKETYSHGNTKVRNYSQLQLISLSRTQVDFSSSRSQEQKSIPCRSIEWVPFFAVPPPPSTLQFIYISLFEGEKIWLIVLCFIFTDFIKRWRWYRIDYYVVWSKMDFILKLGWAFSEGS